VRMGLGTCGLTEGCLRGSFCAPSRTLAREVLGDRFGEDFGRRLIRMFGSYSETSAMESAEGGGLLREEEMPRKVHDGGASQAMGTFCPVREGFRVGKIGGRERRRNIGREKILTHELVGFRETIREKSRKNLVLYREEGGAKGKEGGGS